VAQHKLQKSILSLRSWLFTPATKSDKFSRAAEVHADALIIDLEDSVSPSAKREARETAPYRVGPKGIPVLGCI
jgi:(S)-citramalyl-CoA lyase